MWKQVVGCGLIALCIAGIWNHEVFTVRNIIKTSLPILFNQYWYFTAYFAVYLISPVLNKGILNASKKELWYTMSVCIMLFSVIPTIRNQDIFNTGKGFSVLWLLALYCIGGCIRRLREETLWLSSVKIGILLYLIPSAMCFVVYSIAKYSMSNFSVFEIEFMRRTTPTAVAASIGLFVCCASLNISQRLGTVITRIGRLTFGVYLIHDNIYFRETFITNRFSGLCAMNPQLMIILCFGIAIILFGGCAVLEAARQNIGQMLWRKSNERKKY